MSCTQSSRPHDGEKQDQISSCNSIVKRKKGSESRPSAHNTKHCSSWLVSPRALLMFRSAAKAHAIIIVIIVITMIMRDAVGSGKQTRGPVNNLPPPC